MKINETEILLEGQMELAELTAYHKRACQKYGREPIRMTVRVEGDEAALGYTFAPVPFERIRRITGYLTPSKNWNSGKRAELKDRVAHGMANQCVVCGAEMAEGDQVCANCKAKARDL